MGRNIGIALLAIGVLGSSPGCGARTNEEVFAGGGGRPAPDVPASPEEYDQKYQSSPAPPTRAGPKPAR